MFRKKISWGLALFAAAAAVISCSKDDTPFLDTCTTGDCNAQMIFPTNADSNGYYHIPLDWSRDYLPYFIVDVEADPIIEELRYNGISHVQARFDSDTSWKIGDTLVYSIPLFQPFFGLYTQDGNQLPETWIDVELSQFEGIEVNIAQNTAIQFKQQGSKLVSRRVLGPFIPQMIGDTITVAMKVTWEAGNYTVTKENFLQKFIVE